MLRFWEGAGYSIRILGTDGYTYNYYHINNDTPGTDDGNGGKMNAYAPDVEPGNPVVKGQWLGYVGDSGNAEDAGSHLHFEIYNGNTAVNPYNHLRSAYRKAKPVEYPALPGEILPYRSDAKVLVNVSSGNLDATPGDKELLVGAGPGGGPKVKVFKQNTTKLVDMYTYGRTFRGGVSVAAGDVDNDGVDEIITGAGKGGGPHIKVMRTNGDIISQFMAYSPSNTKGVNVAAGDLDGDGKAEIVTAPLSGASTPVRVYSSTGTLIREFQPYGSSFTGGADVAIGDVDNDGHNDIVTAAGKSGGPHVRVFNSLRRYAN